MPRRPKTHSRLNGLLPVDKPVGVSSMDVVRKVRWAGENAKTGHCGTLDPLASGLVICCLGKATKQVDALMGQAKTYQTDIDLSAFTQTDDLEGDREEVPVDTPPTREQVEAALPSFIGQIQQRPPAYSAIHIDGKRAYQLARKGEEVELPERTVRVDAIHLVAYDWPRLTLVIDCGKGVYIRSLARDIGTALGVGGHLTSLRRTAIGDFRVEQATPMDDLERPLSQDDLLPTE